MEIVKREVVRIQKKLENILSCGFGGDQVLDLLKALQELQIGGTVLTKTRVAMTVNAVKKNSLDDEIVRLAKDLTNKWKKIMARSSSGKENRTPSENLSSKQKDAVNGKPKYQSKRASTHISVLRYPQLRLSFLRGEISPQGLDNLKAILMTSVEMA
jgi:TFIIS helical bundle-like domain